MKICLFLLHIYIYNRTQFSLNNNFISDLSLHVCEENFEQQRLYSSSLHCDIRTTGTILQYYSAIQKTCIHLTCTYNRFLPQAYSSETRQDKSLVIRDRLLKFSIGFLKNCISRNLKNTRMLFFS